ncbi:hypothetical protein J5X84_42730 [Streptosporangiaceae bacterium NEAU-GS5]|nr:hypothetical protein [Streptosporangiaceae bacterium NEAU-GS5]
MGDRGVITAVADAAVRPFLLGGGQALWDAGHLSASREWFDAAYEIAEAEADGPGMALAALGLSGIWVHERDDVAMARLDRQLRRALAAVGSRSPLGIRIRARLAAEADCRTGGHGEILAVAEEARQSGHPLAWAEAVGLAHHCRLGPDDGLARRALAEELIVASFATQRRGDLLLGLLWRTVDLLLDGDPHAERSLSELRGALTVDDHQAIGHLGRALDVMLDIRAGRFDEAEATAHTLGRSAAFGPAATGGDAARWHRAHLICIRWFQGRVEELPGLLRDASSGTLAGLAASAVDHREAAEILLRADVGSLSRSSCWLVSMYFVVESAYAMGDEEAARATYDLLLPYGRLPMMSGLGVNCFGSTEHALGIAALTLGNADLAVSHLRAAVHDNARLGHWPAVALSRSRLAHALRLRGDTAEAIRELGVARLEATELGMTLPEPPPDRKGGRQLAVVMRRGRQWEIALGGRIATVEHSLGMAYLATLVANPEYEILAAELAMGPGEATVEHVSGQAVLDDAAKQAYQRRLAELSEEIAEYDAAFDTARADQARAEREWLAAELASAAGLAGQVRRFTTSEERARISVSKAIRRALDRVSAADAVIGAHFRRTVTTGRRCSYRPS